MLPLHVFAKITPKPEHFRDARAAIRGILAETRVEEGCRSFNLFENEEAGHLFLVEEWTDPAALEAHYAQAYTMRVFEQYQDWLAEAPEIHKMWAT
ncbi:MAG: putative quinol monooxygenase [Pseudomonadota bacterium]